jgi:hypothetical protein
MPQRFTGVCQAQDKGKAFQAEGMTFAKLESKRTQDFGKCRQLVQAVGLGGDERGESGKGWRARLPMTISLPRPGS